MRSKTAALKTPLSLLTILALSTAGLGALSLPASASETKSLVVAGFAPNSTLLTSQMERKIQRFVANNSDYEFVRCVGFADRPGTASKNNSLGQARALAGCDAATSETDLEVSRTAGKWTKNSAGSSFRKVRITLSKYATTRITTSYNVNGGESLVPSVNLAAGVPMVLPTPSRLGYSFVGWHDNASNGNLVGRAGDLHTPKKNSLLWAVWEVPAPSSSGGSSAPASVSITSTGCAIGTGLDLVFDNPGDVSLVALATDYPFTLDGFAVFEFTSTSTSHTVRLTGTTNTAQRHGVCVAHADSNTTPSWSIGQGFVQDAGLQNINLTVSSTSHPQDIFVGRKYFVYVYPTTSSSSARITGEAPRNISVRVE